MMYIWKDRDLDVTNNTNATQGVGHVKKTKLLQAPKFSLHVAPPISNNLPFFGFDDAKLELSFELHVESQE